MISNFEFDIIYNVAGHDQLLLLGVIVFGMFQLKQWFCIHTIHVLNDLGYIFSYICIQKLIILLSAFSLKKNKYSDRQSNA